MSLFQPPHTISLPRRAIDRWDAGRTEPERDAALGDAMNAVIRAVWDAEANWRLDDRIAQQCRRWEWEATHPKKGERR